MGQGPRKWTQINQGQLEGSFWGYFRGPWYGMEIFMQNNLDLYQALCSLRHLKRVFGEEKEDTLGSGT